MKMRELEKRTGVNRETIRVYLREGLLAQPSRPKPNVAEYGEDHVRGIQAIRDLQRDGRVPLGRIRRAVEGDASALPADATAFAHLESLVAAKVGAAEDLVPLDSVTVRNPHAEADAAAFERLGAIRLVKKRGRAMLSRADAQLVGLWGEMRAVGFHEENGFSPDVIEMYVKAASDLAHEEVSRFLALVTGRQESHAAAEMARTAISTMQGFFGLLRMKAVLREIREQTAPAAASAVAAIPAAAAATALKKKPRA
jgi:DNA-binding transcriptional MerR regulator